MFDAYFASVAVFFALLAALIYYDRKHIEFHYVLAMRKTQWGKDFIDAAAKRFPTFWKVFSTVGVVVAFGLMAYGLYLVLFTAQLIVTRAITAPAIQFVIPLPQSTPISGIGFIGVPFWFWILVVPFVLFPHEFSHGVIARVSKVKVKTVGLMQLLIWSGAFVEPDEAGIKKSSLLSKLRIFAAGSIMNVAVVLVLMLLAGSVIWPLTAYDGIRVQSVLAGTGAAAAGLRPGMIIQKINGTEAKVNYELFSASYGYMLFKGYELKDDAVGNFTTSIVVGSAISDFKPGQILPIQADGRTFDVTLSGRPENSTLPYIGIETAPFQQGSLMFQFFFPLIWWLTTLGYLVATFNLLPIHPLDGGLMVEAVVEKAVKDKKRARIVVMAITAVTLGLLVFGFVGPAIIGFFG
jgi:membrane-associated protease RseP (regulator of RpoE activity)